MLAGVATALSFTHREIHRSTATFSFDVPKQLTVDTDESDITLIAVERAGLEVHRVAKWSGPDGPADPEMTGGRLVLRNCSAPWWVRIATYAGCSTSYRLTMPRTAPVAIGAHVADLQVRGAFPSITVTTDVGDLTLGDITAGRVELRSHVGDIDVVFETAPRSVVVDSDVGDVTVTLPPGGYAVSASTGIGDVTVDQRLVNGTSSRVVSVSSNIGDVTVRSR